MQEPGSCNETKLTFRKVNRMKKTKNTTLSEQFQNPIKKCVETNANSIHQTQYIYLNHL